MDTEIPDREQGGYEVRRSPSIYMPNTAKDLRSYREHPPVRKVAGFWGYTFQIVYQVPVSYTEFISQWQ